MGNANTRRNRNRNKLRQQKKVDQQGRNHHKGNNIKALKERNDVNHMNNHETALEPLFEKPPKEEEQTSLKRAVAQQQKDIKAGSGSSEALRMLMSGASLDGPSEHSTSLHQSVLDLESSFLHGSSSSLRLTSPVCSPRTPKQSFSQQQEPPILPQQLPAPTLPFDFSFSNHQDSSTHSEDDDDLILQHILASEQQNHDAAYDPSNGEDLEDHSPTSLGKKREWLLRMNKKIQEVPVGELDPSAVPISAIMNAWAKTKSAQGASMVEMWLRRAQQEYSAGNHRIVPTTKMYTMAGRYLFSMCLRQREDTVLEADTLFLPFFQWMLGLVVASAERLPTVRRPCCTT